MVVLQHRSQGRIIAQYTDILVLQHSEQRYILAQCTEVYISTVYTALIYCFYNNMYREWYSTDQYTDTMVLQDNTQSCIIEEYIIVQCTNIILYRYSTLM